MNDEQTQSLLEAWLRQRAIPGPKVQPGVARVMANVPRTAQQGRWWPLPTFGRQPRTPPATPTDTIEYRPDPSPATNGRGPIVIGRTQTMISPVKAVISGALVFALGGFLLIAQPFGQPGGGVPGAETEVIGPLGANYFTATDTPVSNGTFDWQPGPEYTEAVGITAVTEFVASDPRISGEATWTSTARFYPYGEEGGVDPALWASAVRIENDDGAWVGTTTGYHDPDEATREWNVVDGTGAYEGLTAVFRFVAEGGYEGVIVPGGLPPFPEPVE